MEKIIAYVVSYKFDNDTYSHKELIYAYNFLMAVAYCDFLRVVENISIRLEGTYNYEIMLNDEELPKFSTTLLKYAIRYHQLQFLSIHSLITLHEYDAMLRHYELLEEYEKCSTVSQYRLEYLSRNL